MFLKTYYGPIKMEDYTGEDSSSKFNEAVSKGIILVDFSATWCGPCKRAGPELQKLAATYDTIKFVKIDVDKYTDITSFYDVESMPTFMFFKHGQRVRVIEGFDVKELTKECEKYR